MIQPDRIRCLPIAIFQMLVLRSVCDKPGTQMTQMTLRLIGKDLVLEGSTTRIEDKQVGW